MLHFWGIYPDLRLTYVAYFQWKVSMFVFLSNLKTRQVWISQFHLVFIQKVLGHSAFHSLTIFQLKWKTLHLRWTTSYITNSIFSFHGATMSDLNLETLYFFREFDTLRIGQGSFLILYIPDIKDFAHEIDDGLSLVKSCS